MDRDRDMARDMARDMGQGPHRRLRAGTQLSVMCETLDGSGCGIARSVQQAHLEQGAGLAEPTVTVPGLLPGERAHVRVVHVSAHRSPYAVVMRRQSAAPERQIPACAAYGQCGGCTLQHLSYTAQLRWKRAVVSATLAPVVGTTEHLFSPCVAAPAPLGYRSRVKLIPARAAKSHAADRDLGLAGSRIFLGAYAPRSHHVLDMAGCKVNTPALRAVARALAQAWCDAGLSIYEEQSGRGELRYVLLREVKSGAVQVSLVVADPPPREPLLVVISALRAACPQVQSVVLHHNPHRGNALLATASAPAQTQTETMDPELAADWELGSADQALFGPEFLEEDLGEPGSGLELRVRVSARSFLQVNRAVANRIYADIATALPVLPGETILDLYCGVGGLGRTLLAASRAAEAAAGACLYGIESNPSAVADAEHSARAAGLHSQEARFRCGAVEQELPALAHSGELRGTPVVLLNPPRRGCTKEVLAAVTQCAPRAIAYLSCNPHSLARDLRVLTAAGYEVTRVTPYDMHPGTPHIETVALLFRSRG